MTQKKIILSNSSPQIHKTIKKIVGAQYSISLIKNNETLLETVMCHQTTACIIDLSDSNDYSLQRIYTFKTHYSTYHIPLLILTNHLSSEKLMHAIKAGVDDYLIKPLDPQETKNRIELNIARAKRDHSINPLTLLPANAIIKKTIEKRLKKPFALLYADLDNFKFYNDTYGFNQGDLLIKHTATLISSVVKNYGNHDDFVGHIGGDDFILISTPDKAETIAQNICIQFDQKSKTLCNNPLAPPLSLSIAIIITHEEQASSVSSLAQQAAQLKQFAKTKPGNTYKSTYIKAV